MKRYTLYILFLALVATSCGEYQKLLKSTDYELKYKKAMDYYKAEDYVKATTLFSELVNIYRGSALAEDLTYAYAHALYRMKDYYNAGYYYEQYNKTFPGGSKAEECQFQTAYCKYKLSPKARLDQTNTYDAINDFQLFINLHPNSSRVAEATRLMDELRDKLVYKSYLNAKLYFDLGTYMGNNYHSAVIAAQNSLKEFPDTKYREELSFLILESKYIQAVNSVIEKKDERARDTVDEYYSFLNEFPDSKFNKKAETIFKDCKAMISDKSTD
jgi:outer membrane protein assembly factor BamD